MHKKVKSITTLSLNNVFQHESSIFTPWLKENINILKEELGFKSITITETEFKSENFRVDMIGYINNVEEQRIIIENQFGDSNHDHLGKIITYSAEHNVKWAVWIVENAKKEHIKAIQSLNDSYKDLGFFLIEAKIYKIGESDPAIKFYTKVKPQNINRDSANNERLSLFWRTLLSKENKKLCDLIANRTCNSGNFIDLAGGSGYNYKISVAKKDVRICLVLNDNLCELNEERRSKLENLKESIENKLGALEWDYGWKDTRTKTIAQIIEEGGYDEDAKFSAIISLIIQKLNLFKAEFDYHLRQII